METAIIISTLIASVALIICTRFYYRSKERNALIEKGMDPSLVNIYSRSSAQGNFFLFAGILLLGVAMGISTGIILAKLLKTPGETKELIILSLIIWTGISCILCYFLSREKSE